MAGADAASSCLDSGGQTTAAKEHEADGQKKKKITNHVHNSNMNDINDISGRTTIMNS